MSEDKVAVREEQLPAINELERVHKELARWRDKAFLLTPYARTQFDSIQLGYRPEFRVTYISPDVDDRQVYELDYQKDKLVLTKIGLQLLDHLAGIVWVNTWIALEKDDPTHPYLAKWKAQGKIQDLDGEYRNSICTSTLDLRDGSAQWEKMIKKYPDGRPDTRQLDRARLNIQSQTETLAKNKVRRELLGLQATFTRKELVEKPFVILKLNPVRDMNDPLTRKLVIMQQFGITSEIYDQVAKDIPVPFVGPVPPPLVASDKPIDITAKDVTNEPPVQKQTGRERLIKHIEDLYLKKVKGGRSSTKPPLSSLLDSQLDQLESILMSKGDLVE